MKEVVLNVPVLAAMAGYLLRRWNVDCTVGHGMKCEKDHLRLKNSQTLYRLESAVISPGYATLEVSNEPL